MHDTKHSHVSTVCHFVMSVMCSYVWHGCFRRISILSAAASNEQCDEQTKARRFLFDRPRIRRRDRWMRKKTKSFRIWMPNFGNVSHSLVCLEGWHHLLLSTTAKLSNQVEVSGFRMSLQSIFECDWIITLFFRASLSLYISQFGSHCWPKASRKTISRLVTSVVSSFSLSCKYWRRQNSEPECPQHINFHRIP